MIPALGPQISMTSRAFKGRALTSSSAASSPGQADGRREDDRILVIVASMVRKRGPSFDGPRCRTPSPRASAMTKPQRRILLASAKILFSLARRPPQRRARPGPRLTTPRFIGRQHAPQLVGSHRAGGEAFDRRHLDLLWRQHCADLTFGADDDFVGALIVGAASGPRCVGALPRPHALAVFVQSPAHQRRRASERGGDRFQIEAL